MSRWLKVLIWIVVIAVTVVLLFTVVFPRVERILEDPTMGFPTHPEAPTHPDVPTEPEAPGSLAVQAERSPR